jgi:hypothetical protein
LTGVGLFLLVAGTSAARERPIVVPFRQIDREYRTGASALVDDPTILRRLPVKVFRADRRTYEYLLDHLPLSSKLSGLLGFGRYRVTELEGGRLHGDDRRGVSGDFRLIYADAAKRIFMGEGSFDPWFLPKVTGRVLMVVEYKNVPISDDGIDGRGSGMATRVDVYLKTNKFVGYIIDLLGETADRKLTKLISSAQLTSEKISKDPHEVWGMMNSSGLFDPEELESFRTSVLSTALSD